MGEIKGGFVPHNVMAKEKEMTGGLCHSISGEIGDDLLFASPHCRYMRAHINIYIQIRYIDN